MDKKKKVAVSAVAGLSLVSGAVGVSADEVTNADVTEQPTSVVANAEATTKEVASSTTPTADDVAKSNAEIEAINKEVAQQETAVSNTQTQVNNDQAAVSNAQSAVDKAQENANNATAENIAKAETNVTTAEVAVANAENNVTTAEKAQSAAQDKVNAQETVVANAETAVNQAKNETENAQAAVNQAQSVLNGTGQAEVVKAQENAKNAVNADKKAVSQAEDNVTSAKAADEARQKAIEEAQAKVTTAETANTNAEKALESATDGANKAQTKADQAKSETATAQTAVDQAQAVLDGTGQAEIVKAQQDAQNAVNSDKEAVSNAETNLTNAKAADVARQSAIDNAQADVTTAENVATKAKTALDSTTSTATNTTAKVEAERAEVEKAQAVVAGLESEIANANTITLPEGYVEALKNYYAKKSTAGSALLSQLGKQLISNNSYKTNTADENEIISDVNNLTQAQREDITLFTVDLLNQLRKAFGTTEVVANESAIKFADEIAAAYSTDKWNSFSSSTGHDVNAIKSIASNSGLNGGGQYYENLASSLSPISSVSTNMAEVKKRIYNSLLQML